MSSFLMLSRFHVYIENFDSPGMQLGVLGEVGGIQLYFCADGYQAAFIYSFFKCSLFFFLATFLFVVVVLRGR